MYVGVNVTVMNLDAFQMTHGWFVRVKQEVKEDG